MSNKKIKTVIVVLSCLLAVSVFLLVRIIIFRQYDYGKPDEVSIRHKFTDETATDQTTDGLSATETVVPDDVGAPAEETEEIKPSSTVWLSNRNDDDNVPFSVDNMFPGDSITKYFRVAVSYKNTVYLRYRANVRPGYEKLAEVLKCRIYMPDTGTVMYDGLMKDMPESVVYTLTSEEPTTDYILYEITAYLDTSVGNDYQMKDLVADFRWWVEEKGELQPPPTGDAPVRIIVISAVCALVILLIVLLVSRKKRDRKVV